MVAPQHRARAFFALTRCDRGTGTRPSLQQKCTRRFIGGASRAEELHRQSELRKPFYVTSPIYYVNAAPHVGHLYTMVLTDILKRWQVLLGDSSAKLLTGTDEHGIKIQKAAQKDDTSIKLFCDRHARQFKHLADRAEISYDRFIRTTDPDHKETVEHVWNELNRKGYIYESKHEGWYSISDETFFPQSAVHLVLDPATGRKHMASMETGKEVEWTEETNYHFRLSEFQDRLLKHYKDNPNFIVPRHRMDSVVKEVERGLQDLSISRPVSRLQWGIRVPNDESQTIYVWFDALLNYLTYTGYPSMSLESGRSVWPPNVQVIGKEIVKFHCIYWPAFLMALDLPLPKQFLAHAFWTMNRQKMSKSVGNVVNPFFAFDRFDVDTMRFFMAHDGGINDDAAYDNSFIVERYKNILQNGFGNLVSRIVRSQKWNVRASVESAKTEPSEDDSSDIAGARETNASMLRRHLLKTPQEAVRLMGNLDPRGALVAIVNLIYNTNRYLQHSGIWRLADKEDPNTQKEVHKVIFTCAESIRIIAILLQPFMPSKMERCLDLLGVGKSRRTFQDARFGVDFDYGKPLVDPGKAGSLGTLFPPLVSECKLGGDRIIRTIFPKGELVPAKGAVRGDFHSAYRRNVDT